MNIQSKYAFLCTFLWIALLISSCISFKVSKTKPIGKQVGLLNIALSGIIFFNILIGTSSNTIFVTLGYFGYYICVSLSMMALVCFTNEYCKGIRGISAVRNKKQKPTVIYIASLFDILQLLVGVVSGHVIELKPIQVEGKLGYIAIPQIGLTIHRVVNYCIFLAILLIFLVAICTTSKVLREKFTTIFWFLIATAIMQGYSIFASNVINLSVFAYAFLGFVIFHSALIRRPVKLLDRMLSRIVSNMDDAVFVFDPVGHPIWLNENAIKVIGTANIIQTEERLEKLVGHIPTESESWSEERLVNYHGKDKYFLIDKKTVRSDDRKIDGHCIIISDVTKRHEELQHITYAATHDELTGIYNRKHLFQRIASRLKTSYLDYYIVYVNIKNFKLVNEIFGNDFGDEILIRVAQWIKTRVSSNGIYGRLVSDTFGVLIPVVEFDKLIANNDLSSFVIKNKDIEHQIFVHIGVYRIIDNGIDISLMFDRAKIALNSVTNNYTTCISYYDETLKSKVQYEQEIISDFRKAIDNNQIGPFLQPIVDVNKKIVGAEALARWIHPDKGFLSPISFIPVFEKHGIIVDADKHVWRRSCEILKSWQGKMDDVFISVNISPKDFYFIDVVSELIRLTEEYGIDRQKLRIEITETVFFDNAEDRIKVFDKFREAGFIVEMDDFGSGYSSLNMLKDVSVDVLKIDMKFLSSDNEKSRTIVNNVIRLSNELNMTTLTEGVETEQQYNQLIEAGCLLFQGYYFAKPMAIEDFEDLYKRTNGEL